MPLIRKLIDSNRTTKKQLSELFYQNGGEIEHMEHLQ